VFQHTILNISWNSFDIWPSFSSHRILAYLIWRLFVFMSIYTAFNFIGTSVTFDFCFSNALNMTRNGQDKESALFIDISHDFTYQTVFFLCQPWTLFHQFTFFWSLHLKARKSTLQLMVWMVCVTTCKVAWCSFGQVEIYFLSQSQSYFATDDQSVSPSVRPSVRPSWHWAPL
jgi:hypothetical protein